MRWLKAVIPVLVLGLSLVMIFLAFYQASPPFPQSISQDRHSALGCFGDRECEQDLTIEREQHKH